MINNQLFMQKKSNNKKCYYFLLPHYYINNNIFVVFLLYREFIYDFLNPCYNGIVSIDKFSSFNPYY